ARMLQRLVRVWVGMSCRATGAVRLATRRPPYLPGGPPHAALAAGGPHLFVSLVPPALWVIDPVLAVQPGEHAVKVLRVREVLGQDHWRVGVGDDVVAEVFLVLQDVVD